MNLTTITCTGDRPEAFALCEKYLARQTVKPFQILVLDDGEVPIVPRIGEDYHYWPELRGRASMPDKLQRVIDRRLIKGDAVVIWEDDDWYCPNYLGIVSRWLERWDLVGESRAIYYNVAYRWWGEHSNTQHASLCMTSLLTRHFGLLLELNRKGDPFLDEAIWKKFQGPKLLAPPLREGPRMVIGMKSMPGRKGYGGGHCPVSGKNTVDPMLAKLRELIGEDAEAYAGFYGHLGPAPTNYTPEPPAVEPASARFRHSKPQPFDLPKYQQDWSQFAAAYKKEHGTVANPLLASVQEEFRQFRERSAEAAPAAVVVSATPSVEVHLLCWNEAAMLPYAIRHYRTFAQKIVVHDAGSTDGSRELAASLGAEVQPWDTGNEFNDLLARKLKNECWRGTKADWVIPADMDEFIYFPKGAAFTLNAYAISGVPMAKPSGWEMFSETFPTTTGQIYDEVKFGAQDDKWYAKPILFTPRLVRDSGIGMGAHEADPVLKSGVTLPVHREYPKSTPPVWLLHMHQLGPIERIAKLYDERRKRLCEMNVKNRWGNIDDSGTKHAQDKRAFIKAGLTQVVP